ncbi:hypothetical protein AX17_001444 [Amanita inopinata Kibby_2008]|nr:hypothetical protein AX17_001444 [Amanita inopinata Kibby_2008]
MGWVPLLLVACLGFLVHRYLRQRTPRGVSLPPGPRGLPVIGLVRNVPHDHAWVTYAEWAKQYGDIVYTKIYGQPLVILNSVKATNEIFDRRSAIYSDRPRMVMANELMGYDWDFVHMPYSERWRQHRRVFHQSFQARAIPEYYPVMRHAAAKLALNLSAAPEVYADHIRQFAGGIVLRVTYGHNVTSRNDDYVHLAKEALAPLLQAVHAGSFLVDFIPALKYVPSWLPGAGFKRRAIEWSKSGTRLLESPFQSVKTSMADGNVVQCFVSEQLEKARNNADPALEEVAKNCAGIAYAAGSDTTVALLESWLLAMVMFPEVQRRAREEVDSAVGAHRLPDFCDRAALPYIDAMISETLRWNPPTPLAVPHRALQDDIYEGFFIPKGATVVGNSWATTRNEEVYPEPERFIPERFLQQEGKDVELDPIAGGAFGFGRRICPGRHLATSSGWLAMAYILTLYEISCAVDEDGKDILPTLENTSGVVVHPKPFKIRVTVRSKEAMSLIQAMNEESFTG